MVMKKAPFTLIEIMMSVLILGTAVVTLMRIVTNSLHQLDQSQKEVYKEKLIYEVLAADRISNAESETGAELLEYPGVSWEQNETEGSLGEDIYFKSISIRITSADGKLVVPDVIDEESVIPQDGALVLERID